jgi:hypothetical protein
MQLSPGGSNLATAQAEGDGNLSRGMEGRYG